MDVTSSNQQINQQSAYLNKQMLTVVALMLIVLGMASALYTVHMHTTTAHRDDVSVTYAHLMRYPERFEHDVISIYGIGSTWGTIVNWGSGVLWRDLNIHPEVTYIFWAFLQAFFIGFAPFFLTLTVTSDYRLALITIPLAYVARLTQSNLAEYASLFPFLYVGDLAIYVAVLSIAFLIRQQKAIFLAFLFFIGLLHPSIATYVFVIAGLYWLWQLLKTRDKQWIIWFIALGVIGLTIVAPRFLVVGQAEGTIPPEIMSESVRDNQHFYPYEQQLRGSPRFIGFTAWMIFLFLSTATWQSLPLRARQLLILTVLTSVGFSIVQFMGVQLNIMLAIQLVGGRATQLAVLMASPFILYHWWRSFQSGHWQLSLLVVVLMSWFLLPSHYIFHPNFHSPLLILSFALLEMGRGRLAIFDLPTLTRYRTPFFAAAMFLMVVAVLGTVVVYGLVNAVSLSFFGMCVLIIFFRQKRNFITLPASPIFLVIGMVLFTGAVYINLGQQAQTFASAEDVQLYEAQVWARENTPEDAMFAGVVGTWRAVSERPYLHVLARPLFVYYIDERLYTYLLQLQRWLESGGDGRNFYGRTEDNYLQLRDIAPINYLVFQTSAATLGFEIAYQNDTITIYQLP